ncbi:hypothetical protein TcasGA2_TC004869 [Tribolium castaneum]|uniref:Uncharacterized protein n=1 Tax=Tribolium castaneum TaxID=7070 RepID=D6WBM9_TRICA|nr:hypothetical protein TcasGA2_TC004869 [Tribolium castaneum]
MAPARYTNTGQSNEASSRENDLTKAKASKPTSAAILLLAYSIRMGPRSEESRKEPCSAAMTCAAQRTSWYSMKATGDPPLLCMRRRQKPGKLCNKNTTSAAQCRGTTANYRKCEGSTHSECATALDIEQTLTMLVKKQNQNRTLITHAAPKIVGEVETEVLASRVLINSTFQ